MTSSQDRLLIVMRHAKTEGEAESDAARRLTDRGQADAIAAGRWLAEAGHVPDHVLVSSATRARQTLEQVATGLGSRPEHTVSDELYGADADAVVDLCRGLPRQARCVLVIGHDPTMAEFVRLMRREPGQEGQAHLPTSGIVVLAIRGEWGELQAGTAELAEQHLRDG